MGWCVGTRSSIAIKHDENRRFDASIWRKALTCSPYSPIFVMTEPAKRRSPTTQTTLDAKDQEIIGCLQIDANQTMAELSATVHLSESSTRRRVERLRHEGVIERFAAIINPLYLSGVQVIVHVSFAEESPQIYARFRHAMQQLKEVEHCYSTAGDVDFVLIVRARDLAAFEAWGECHLMSWKQIKRYSSQVVWSVVKQSIGRLL
jgi:Lrp/AsnC family transcriptional regulator, leucine-responsive regulatory protein